MLNGSHSRHSYPANKHLPLKPASFYSKLSSEAKQVLKGMHKKKNRQINKQYLQKD